MTPSHFNPVRSLIVSAAFLALPTTAQAQESVQYQFEFISEWSVQTHPTSFPSNPHFSSVIGATHNDSVSIWEPGGIATHGIERMAESGTNGTLLGEVNILIDQGGADQFFNMGGIPVSPGQRVSTITVNADFPLISLVSMIAPSPDWFIGVHDIDLREDGIWARELVFDLDPYDSGTDSGTNYTSVNADIDPHNPIENIANQFPFTGTPRIGYFRFTLISDAACSLADFAEPYNELNFFDVSAFLSAFSAQSADADLNDDGELNFFDVSDFLTALSAGCP